MKVSTKIEGGPGDWEFTIALQSGPGLDPFPVWDGCGYDTRKLARAAMLDAMREIRDALDAEIKRLDR